MTDDVAFGIVSSALGERITQLGIEPNRLHRRGARTDWRTTTTPAKRLLNVETRLGLRRKTLDQLVGNRDPAGRHPIRPLVSHRHPPERNRLYFGRILIAWIATSKQSPRATVTTSIKSASRVEPRYNRRSSS
jgi:hypothetical protein